MLRRALCTFAVVGLIAVMVTSALAQGQERQGRGGQGRGGQGRGGQGRTFGGGGFGGFGGGGFGGGGFGGGGFGRGGGGAASLASVAQREDVQKETEMSEDQIKEFGAARQEVSDDIRGLDRPSRDASEEDREKYFAQIKKIQTRLDREVEEILLPHQSDRLWELYVQRTKSYALDHPVIAKKLEITEAQKKALAEVTEKQQEARMELFRSMFGNRGGGGDAGGRTRGGRPSAEGEEGARPRGGRPGADNNGASIENGQGQVFVQQQERPQRGQAQGRDGQGQGRGGQGRGGQGRGGFDAEAITEMREKASKLEEETHKKRLAKLTATQDKKFKEMAGEKFEFTETQRNFGGRTRGGQEGQGGRTRGGRPGAEGGGRGEGGGREGRTREGGAIQ